MLSVNKKLIENYSPQCVIGLLLLAALLHVDTAQADNQVVVVPIAGETVRAAAPIPVVRDTPPLENYEIRGNQVIDRASGYRWYRVRSSSTMTWKEAVEFCKRATKGRLPTIQEMITLFRFGRSPMIDNTVFPAGAVPYWTSTYAANDVAIGSYEPNSRWVADFTGLEIEGAIGRSSLQSFFDRHHALCIYDLNL